MHFKHNTLRVIVVLILELLSIDQIQYQIKENLADMFATKLQSINNA